MSSYHGRFLASSIIRLLDQFEEDEGFDDGPTSDKCGMDVLSSLVKAFEQNLPNQHLPSEIKISWEEFRKAYKTDPNVASDSARGLRSHLINTYVPQKRWHVYHDSGIFVIDRKAYKGLTPEQLHIIEYFCEHAGEWVNTYQIKMGIGILKEVDERTVRRHINSICRVLRKLIESHSGKGHLFRFPPTPV